MVKISVYQDGGGRISGFRCTGHAGYANSGQDIVCAAVSALTVTAVNSVESLTQDKFSYEGDEEKGLMDFKVTAPVSDRAALILKSMFLGLMMIEESYGPKFIQVDKGIADLIRKEV